MKASMETSRLIYWPEDFERRDMLPTDVLILELLVEDFVLRNNWGTDHVQVKRLRFQSRDPQRPPGPELEFRISVNLKDCVDSDARAEQIKQAINEFVNQRYPLKDPAPELSTS